MSTITKERLEPVIERLEHYATNVKWTNVQAAQDMLIAVDAMRIALASLEAEAAITVGDDGGDALAYRRLIQTFAPGTKLYTAPPAPVSVPEPIKRNDADGWWMYKGRRVGGGCAEWYNRALDDCRAAMLQGAEPVTTAYKLRDAVETIRNSGIAIDAEKILAERDALNAPDCWCRTCRPITLADMRFVVCPVCGNKRCPHANDHRNACTGSNEPGQEGSAYPAAPQQEVKP
ncbi:hypothetical protein [Enterobacter roggenkampii]|uniref:hypothetical protein n=1 Tax=Enterobacter roggenkampii TaxID=1812935 RepID=UPI001E29F875|nr:hypothetical protein [Enterobacter roggenkampii]